ncbi:MAG: class I mannose-6-phosphate isomerase [Clostridiales bacterium]|nr:class I mannose-6-phosphate isomerase [Clostridiales bacterium]
MDKYMPVKLSPAFKDYLWGGTRLKEEYNKKTDMQPLAESWELSCHKDGESRIAGGCRDGKTLSEYIEYCGRDILGKNAERFDYFPVLIKLIDAKTDLSVQVHPDDEYALENEGEYGKTEMWYVLEADPGAHLYYGFNRDVTRREFAEKIKNNTITEVLNRVNVKKGDVFFIGAGTLHAICGGIVICEIQQNSNTTYRVYDYDRRDKNGKTRPLHIEKALEVTNLNKAPEIKKPSGDVLAECKYFRVSHMTVSGRSRLLMGEDSFAGVIVAEGNGKMLYNGQELSLLKGDSYFVPAQNNSIDIEGSCELIITKI